MSILIQGISKYSKPHDHVVTLMIKLLVISVTYTEAHSRVSDTIRPVTLNTINDDGGKMTNVITKTCNGRRWPPFGSSLRASWNIPCLLSHKVFC